jgi:hypothetical protein
VLPVRYELGSYISEVGILHSHRRENLKSDMRVVGSEIYGQDMDLSSLIPRRTVAVFVVPHGPAL